MAAQKFSVVAAGAAGLFLTGMLATSSAAAREPWPGDPDRREPARPHPNCEALSNQEMLECERRMRERMRNSSDDSRTLQGAEEATDRQRARTPQQEDRARTEDRSRSSRSQPDRSATEPTSDGSDTLGRHPPDNSDNHTPQSTTQTDTSAKSRDSNQDADTLDRDRNNDNSATDTSSPK